MGRAQDRLVILTGMSGAGKSTALRCFEDLGYYCIDNLPPSLIKTFIQLYDQAQGQGSGIAVVCDVRSGELFSHFRTALDMLNKEGYEPQMIFLDCEDDRLVARFKESRRIPPLGTGLRIEEALAREAEHLDPLKELASHVIDTTDLSAQQLRDRILGLFADTEAKSKISLTFLSFGFKNGIPADADFVFDTRMLPNPYYVEELKDLTGNDQQVQDYVFSNPVALQLVDKIREILMLSMQHYATVHKFNSVAAIGCTGGKHRSVSIANRLAQQFETDGVRCTVQHRDIARI